MVSLCWLHLSELLRRKCLAMGQLIDWEQEKLEHDEDYCKGSIYKLLEHAKKTADKLWSEYLTPALEIRRKIIEQALGLAANKPIKEAKEILLKAHRKGYVKIEPNMRKISKDLDKLVEIAELDKLGLSNISRIR